jgi:hypothetical protein
MATQKKPSTTEVATQQAVAVAQPSTAMMAAMLASQGQGSENVTAADIIIPSLKLLQALSPEIQKRGSSYVEGAEEGMLLNSLTQELYGMEQDIIPCYYYRSWVEFIPKNDDGSGGGFVAEHMQYDTTNLKPDPKTGRPRFNEKGNEIVETGTHACLLIKPNGDFEPIVIRCTSTKWKASRKLNTLIEAFKRKIKTPTGQFVAPPRFAMRFKLISVFVDQSPSYFTFDVADEGLWATEEQMAVGQGLYQSMSSGEVKAGIDSEHAETRTEDAAANAF